MGKCVLNARFLFYMYWIIRTKLPPAKQNLQFHSCPCRAEFIIPQNNKVKSIEGNIK